MFGEAGESWAIPPQYAIEWATRRPAGHADQGAVNEQNSCDRSG